jgi:hypothetical protein
MWEIILLVAAGVLLVMYVARRRTRLRGENLDKK